MKSEKLRPKAVATSRQRDQSAVEVPALTPDARQMVTALASWELTRYDFQVRLEEVAQYAVEEVFLFKNHSRDPMQLVPLPARYRGVQGNWKARDADGSNLIILARSETSTAYQELYSKARALLRASAEQPKEIAALFKESVLFPGVLDSWARQLMAGGSADEEASLARVLVFLKNAASTIYDQGPGDTPTAALFILSRIAGALDRTFVPWVYLDNPCNPIDPGRGQEVEGRVFIKLMVWAHRGRDPLERWPLRWYSAFGAALFGSFRFALNPPYVTGCSTHIRIRPPDGLVLLGRVIVPSGVAPNDAERVAVHRRQLQVQLDPQTVKRKVHEWRKQGTNVIVARCGLPASSRFLLAVLFGILSLVPVLLASAGLRRAGETQLSVTGTLEELSVEHALAAATLALPLAIAILVTSWELLATRAMAITQVILAAIVAGVWLVVQFAPPLALVPLLGGVLWSLLNLVEGLRVLSPMNLALREARPSTSWANRSLALLQRYRARVPVLRGMQGKEPAARSRPNP